MTSSRTPSTAELLARLLDERGAVLFVARPGRVVSYDSTSRTAVVKPMQKVVLPDGDGTRQAHELDAIHAVPVVWPGQIELAAGDGVLLVFCDHDIGSWRSSGGTKPADPGDETAHGPSGAVAIPGLDVVSRKNVEISQAVALANLVATNLSALKTAITNTTIVANDGGASFKTTLLAALSSWPTSTASAKVKVLV